MPDPTPLTPAEIKARIEAALAALHARPRTPGLEVYEEDRARFLKSADKLGEPELVLTEGKPVRYATPLLWGDRVGGFVASDPWSGEVLSWPSWAPGPLPLIAYTADELARFVRQDDPRIHEIVPREIRTPTRFAVDPEKLQGAYLIDRYQALPFKNQEERYAWVEEVNRTRRMRTEWRHKGGFQEPSYKCLSFASSTVADWWGLMYGVPPGASYQNFVNGTQEYGVNPRELEVLYYHRARRRGGRYYKLTPRLVKHDPVTRERIASSSTAFARLICSPEEIELDDPLTRDGLPKYKYRPGMWHQDGPPRTLFTKGKGADAALIREALHRHGIVLAFTQARVLRVIRFGLHGIPIVGYYRKGKDTVFIYHESYGNHGPGYVWDDSGGPSYMTIPANFLREASVFPHRLWMDVEPVDGALVLNVTHSGGGHLATPPPAISASGAALASVLAGEGRHRFAPPAGPALIAISVDREYFRREDGRPFEAVFPWPGGDPAALALARWLFLARQLEARAAEYRPPHLLVRLSALESELVALARRPDMQLERLLPLRQVVDDRDITLLQTRLLPRLLEAGLPPEIARRVMS